jgi:hypothetical protein
MDSRAVGWCGLKEELMHYLVRGAITVEMSPR